MYLFLTVLQKFYISLSQLSTRKMKRASAFYQSCLTKIWALLCSNRKYILLHNHFPNTLKIFAEIS